MFFFRKTLSLINIYALSLPMGLFFWGFILLTVLISGLPFNAYVILFLNLFILTILILFNLKNKNFSRKDLIYTAVYFTSFTISSILLIFVNYSTLSNDSWRLLIGGRYIATYNNLSENLILTGGTYSFFIHSSSRLFGFDYLYALFPLMALSFFLFYFCNLYSPFRGKSLALNREFLFSLLSVLFLLSSYFILFNTYYLHSNLIYGVYFFIALYGLWKRLMNGERNWLIVSCVALLTSSFLRTEGPLFSLIIIIILVSSRIIQFKEKLYYVGTILLFVVAWYVKLLLSFPGLTSRYSLSTDRVVLFIILYFLTFTALLLSQKRTLSRLKKYYPLIMLYSLSLLWSILILTRGLKIKDGAPVLKRYGMFIENTIKYGGWGITWIVLVVLFVVGLILKRIKYESVFLYGIFSFTLLFNSIHLYRGGWTLSWGDSGNRMLLHVIFVISFYAFLKFKNVLLTKTSSE
jgi:hypothetical protein